VQIVNQSYEILTPINEGDICKLIEGCGRVSYKSEGRITKDSYTEFINKIISNGHHSVLEHFNISVRFITNRAISHEIVRHRLCSFTQESTRYVNYKNKGMVVIQPLFVPLTEEYSLWYNAIVECEKTYNRLLELGATPQEARGVLPNDLKTEIIVTANIREWRHILKLRTAKGAHPQMIALMKPLLFEFKSKLGLLFGDL
jgi:thymidylate synthase (FAD)